MIPYATFTYFGVLLYPVVPAVLLRIVLRRIWVWTLIATLLMLVMQYSGTFTIWPSTVGREIWLVVAYGLFQLMIASAFVQTRVHTRSRWPFYGAVALGLLPLVTVRTLPTLVPGSLAGFLGISYVTFRALDVIFSIRDGVVTSIRPGQMLAFLFFFPTISSGPIDRFRRFVSDWEHPRTRAELLEDLDGGLHRIMTAFLYKFILAALIKEYWLDRAAAGSGLLNSISYMYAYSFFLFFDFAGYSLFAIGVSYLFGIHTPENFNRPFLATNIQDFWNRWHITLSWWLRDRVYRRFGLTALRGHWFKREATASYVGFFLSFGLMGLWHGTQPFYLLYGLYHAVLMSSYEAFNRWNSKRHFWGDGPVWRAAAVLITFHVVCFGFLLFSGRLGPAGSG
jgi:membrane protein involved in D-alanine export